MTTLHTKSSLIQDLHALGLNSGDGVFVHASMRAMGVVEGGAATVIEALLDAVGPEGLVGMPGFSDDAYPPADMDPTQLSEEEIARIEHAVTGFDIARSPTSGMGVLAETFRTWPGTLRSPHPAASVCLNGPDASELAFPHDAPWATGRASPFGRMEMRPGMKILLIGVGWNRCTPCHTAEGYAAHCRLKTRRFKSGPGNALWFETPDVADDLGRIFPRLGAAFEVTGQVTNGPLGDAQTRLCGYSDFIAFATHWIDAENEKSGARH